MYKITFGSAVPSLCPVPANADGLLEKIEDDPDDDLFKFNPFFNFSLSLSIVVRFLQIYNSQ